METIQKTTNNFELFHNLVDNGKTILMVTHDNDLTRRVGRTVTLADAHILNEHLTKVFSMLTHDLLLKATRQMQRKRISLETRSFRLVIYPISSIWLGPPQPCTKKSAASLTNGQRRHYVKTTLA